MKKRVLVALFVVLALILTASLVWAGGINDPKGFPLYVIIEVEWDGSSDSGDWTVWGPKWDPEVETGDHLTGCTDCLEMNYTFTFRGSTVHFDETYVPGVIAYPQVRHVVLHDTDRDGTYTGSLSSECYEFPSRDGAFHDRIDYQITFDEQHNVTDFYYLEYEHWNQDPSASCD